MNYKDSISSMKKSAFDEAFKASLLVADKNKNVIGRLVPVGEWIIGDKEKIELICAWRQKTMQMFLTQFSSTFDKTLSYLKNISIGQEGRIFFLLYDGEDRFIGHMGAAGIDGKTGELDNLMRGIEGGDARLVYFAEIALLDWCFKILGIAGSDVNVLSYNWLVLALHEEVGYIHEESMSLKKNIKDGIISHDICALSESNVKYSYKKMFLSKERFYQVNAWL